MSRTLSSAARLAMFSQETDKIFLPLLKINHATLGAPLRFTRNTVQIISKVEDGSTSQTFLPYPFNLNLPDDTQDSTVKTVQLAIDNIDRSITAAVRSIASAATVTLWIVLATTPDTIEAGPFTFSLSDVTYDAFTVSGTLTYEDRLQTRVPGLDFNPFDFPGLF